MIGVAHLTKIHGHVAPQQINAKKMKEIVTVTISVKANLNAASTIAKP